MSVARRSDSTNTTCAAPRLSASNPSAPVPAKPSSTRAPSMRGASTLKSVSRRRSEVGRSPAHEGDARRRPLRCPAMIRTLARLRLGGDKHEGSASLEQYLLARPPGGRLANLDETELRVPLVADDGRQRRRQPCLDLPPRLPVGYFQDVAVAYEVPGAELRQPRLPRAEEVARSTQLEIALGNREAVVRLGHRPQPLARVVAPRRLIEQDAVRVPLAAADPSAELVQLREAEALGVLHHHHRGVGHVHADLDDRR